MCRVSRLWVWLLSAGVVLLAVVGDLHVHVDHHEGQCLDSPRGGDSRLHAHGPCAVCQQSRQLAAEAGQPLSSWNPSASEEPVFLESIVLLPAAAWASAPSRAPPVLL